MGLFLLKILFFFFFPFDNKRLAAVLLEWLRELPLSIIPPDMYVLFSEAEKIHEDDEHLLHSIHSLVNSMPKAHRTCLQYVCFIFKVFSSVLFLFCRVLMFFFRFLFRMLLLHRT